MCNETWRKLGLFISNYFLGNLTLISHSWIKYALYAVHILLTCVLMFTRASSERKVSRKNAKIFVRISQTFSRNFALFRENKWSANKAKTKRNFAKMRNSWVLLLQQLIPQKNLWKFYHVILIISLPLL